MDANDGTLRKIIYISLSVAIIMAEGDKKKLIASLIRNIPDFPIPGIIFR